MVKMVQLTDEQEAVLKNDQNPELVIAGAGTGKTTTMTQMVEASAGAGPYIGLVKHHVLPHEVMAISFTNDNANHFHEVLPDNLKDVQTSTVDSLVIQLLNELLLKSNLKIQLQSDLTMVLSANAFYNFLVENNMIPAIAFRLGLQPRELTWRKMEEIVTQRGDQYHLVSELILHGFNQWQLQKLNETGSLIYNLESVYDLFNLLFQNSDFVPSFRMLIVDEAQDLNRMQLSLIESLYDRFGKLDQRDPRYLRVVLIGDPTQSIFRFNGSDPTYLVDFVKKNGSTPLTLTKNFRSSPETLKIGNALLADNFDNLAGMQLQGQHDDEEDSGTSYLGLGPSRMRVEFVSQEIDRLVHEKGIKPSQIAVLARSGLFNDTYGPSLATRLNEALPDDIHISNAMMGSTLSDLDNMTLKFLSSLEIMNHVFTTYDREFSMDVEEWINVFLTPLEKGLKADDPYPQALSVDIDIPMLGRQISRNLLANTKVKLTDDQQQALYKVVKLYQINNFTKLRNWQNNVQNILVWIRTMIGATRSLLTILKDGLLIDNDDDEGIVLDTIHGAKGSEWDYVFVLPENAGWSDKQQNMFYCYDRNHDIQYYNAANKTQIQRMKNELPSNIWMHDNPDAEPLIHGWQDQQDCAYVAMTRAKIHTYIVPSQYTREMLLERFTAVSRQVSGTIDEICNVAWGTIPNETLVYSGFVRIKDQDGVHYHDLIEH